MKKLMLALAVAIGSHALAANSLNDGLVAYYKFDGDANDSSGNGNHGTYYNCGPSADRNFEMDMAFYFGSSGWVSVPNSPSLDSATNALSVSFWIDANPYMEGGLPILSGSESNQYYFAFADGVTRGAVGGVGATFCGAGGEPAMFSLGRDYPFGAFHHWAMTSSGGRIKIYLDGELIASKDGCGFPYAKGCDLLIGRTRDTLNGELNDGLDGRLDELRIYNRALSDSEVQAIYQLEFPIPKYWTVKLVLNGGTCETDEVKVLDRTMMDIDTMPYPERFGYYFAGWFTDPSCMDLFFWWEVPVWDDMTLYAGWDRDPLSINSDGGWVLCRWKQEGIGLSVAGVVENDVPANLVIPEETNAEPIEDIEAYAFAGEGGISNVVLGANVRWIWEGAFKNCPDLQSVTILGDDVWIGAQAFASCPKLRVVRLKCAPPIVDAGSGDECDSVFFNSPNVRIVVESDEGWKDENGNRMTEWCGRKVFYNEPLANLGESATANEIADALKGFADEQLTARIKSGKQYGAFKAWHDGVCGGDIDKWLTLVESPCVWFSYALGLNAPLSAAPTQGALKVTKFSPMSEGRSFDLELAINDIAVSGDATTDNLATVFSVEGCKRLGDGFAADTLTADFSALTDGKVKVRITPKDENADSFFARVGLNPSLVDETDKLMK